MAEESKSPSPKSPHDNLKQFQVQAFFPPSEVGDMQMFPVMYPVFVPIMIPSQNQEQADRGAGIYAVPVPPFTGPISGIPSDTLIPLTYNLLVRPFPSGSGAEGDEIGQGAQQQPAPQRQVVARRFQIAVQLDLLLILKLAAVIFLFNQDGSRQRLTLLVFFASIVYLYQTGALAPLMRWLSQGMQRAAAPPQLPRQAVRADNVPPVERQGNENAAADGQVVNENRPAEELNEIVENERDAAEMEGAANNNQWWGIVKEIQVVVFGFITSLLPGFHNVD